MIRKIINMAIFIFAIAAFNYGYSQQGKSVTPSLGDTSCFEIDVDEVVTVFEDFLLMSFDGSEIDVAVGSNKDHFYFAPDDPEKRMLNLVTPSGSAYEIPHDKTLRYEKATEVVDLIDEGGCEIVKLLSAGSSTGALGFSGLSGLHALGGLAIIGSGFLLFDGGSTGDDVEIVIDDTPPTTPRPTTNTSSNADNTSPSATP